MTDTTMTIRISSEMKEKLGRLAHDTRRSRSFLAAEAVTAYVERELEIVEGIRRGLAATNAEDFVSHDDAMAEIYADLHKAQNEA
ncbi:ribbon-helix-helix protein, CopG family [Phyllobacterium sp. 628]|uniref:CopG family ribbon-helix-helix protein n=1 Tax=Phyllobacterium sp. 628 TaxID=2718938 RepID=UPI00166233C8|nr:ribbon-helix-helix protein, CopG family [Phyllobacterium sp. 628]QND51419.1 ribbon-helix-helix protein, CopG family [Phyllobacterium sp. 628]